MRLLERAGTDAPSEARAKATAFRQLLVAIIAVEAWDSFARSVDAQDLLVPAAVAVLSTLGASLAWSERWHRVGLAFIGTCVAVQVASAFPGTANHHYLELVCVALLLLLRTSVDAEAQRLTVSLRLLLVVALFQAGAQKVAWGYYFDGAFLSFAVSQSERFALLLEPLIPAAEFARLTALSVADGAGPFRVSSLPFVVVSNVAYAAELVLPVLLLVPPVRKPAVVLVIAYFVSIEAAAREVFFGGIMVALALLFLPGSALRRARPLYLLALGYLLAMIFGLLPRWEFT